MPAIEPNRGAESRYGWLRGYRSSIEKWSRWEAWEATGSDGAWRASVSYVRTHGLSSDSESSASARVGECLVGSTEVLESLFGKWLFGKWKTLERQESQSDITGLILSLGALLGSWSASRIQAALEVTREEKTIDEVIRVLRKKHGKESIEEFGPTALSELREQMIDDLDWSRQYINKQLATP